MVSSQRLVDVVSVRDDGDVLNKQLLELTSFDTTTWEAKHRTDLGLSI